MKHRLLLLLILLPGVAGCFRAKAKSLEPAADTAPGASGCQPAQGQITAAAAQAGVLQLFVPAHAPINEINLQSLCLQP